MGAIQTGGETYWIPAATFLMTRMTKNDYLFAFRKVFGKARF